MRGTGQVDHHPALDGFRAIAVLLVIAYHTHVGAFRLGWAGVSLFFGLSGFLITGILIRAKGARSYFRVFYIRRALRIFPLYYSLLAFGVAMGLFLGVSIADTPWYVLYLQNYLLGATGWSASFPEPWNHTWSLAVEEQFYLVVPFLVHALTVRVLERLFLIVIAASMVFKVFWLQMFGPGTALYTHTLSHLDLICAGCWLACRRHDRAAEGLQRNLTRLMVAAGFFLALYTFISPQVHAPWAPLKPGDPSWLGIHVFTVAAVPVLLNGLTTPTGWVLAQRALGIPVLRWMGKVSYGLYLYHWIVFRCVDMTCAHYHWPQDHAAAWLLRLGLTFTAAAISWRWFEEPLLRLKDRVTYTA